MKTYLDCIPCLMNQSLRAVRAITDDEEVHRRVLNVLTTRIPELSLNLKPPEIAQQGYRIIREITGNSDPFWKIKTQSNETVLKLYPYLKELITRSKDHVLAACKLAIACNWLLTTSFVLRLNRCLIVRELISLRIAQSPEYWEIKR